MLLANERVERGTDTRPGAVHRLPHCRKVVWRWTATQLTARWENAWVMNWNEV